METVEILIFEYNQVYGTETVPVEKGVDTFVRMCCDFIPPETDAYLGQTDKTIYYSENFGGDKPRTIMLVHSITSQELTHIRKRLAQRF